MDKIVCPSSSSVQVPWIRIQLPCLVVLYWYTSQSACFEHLRNRWRVYLLPANEVCKGCFYTCLSVHRGVWYPSMPCRSPGVVSQHALHGSRPTPREVSRPTLWGVSRPTPRVVFRPQPGGGVYPSMHWGRPPSWRLLPWAVRILLEWILVTHVFILDVSRDRSLADLGGGAPGARPPHLPGILVFDDILGHIV